jgi:demethylmenaquinone methyltransferase/2-methoxy-6-polyprenyl-1,4-benzoquinol methylase
MDPAERMLEIGRQKIERAGLSDAVYLARGTATAIPAKNEHFDVVTISFGIRNVADISASLREAYRVLKPSGRFLILEFSLPRSPLICAIYLVYLRHILPRVGAMVSGDAFAYRYLNETIETFPYGRQFCRLLSQAGFKAVFARSLPPGIVTIYHGQKSQ